MTLAAAGALRDYILSQRHVGFIADDLDGAIANLTRVYGLREQDVRLEPADESADARFAFVTVGDTLFELIEPRAAWLRQALAAAPSGSGGINHIAFTVRDLEGALVALAARGVRPGHVTPGGAVAFSGRQLVYLDPATTGGLLIELVEDL